MSALQVPKAAAGHLIATAGPAVCHNDGCHCHSTGVWGDRVVTPPGQFTVLQLARMIADHAEHWGLRASLDATP